MVYKESKKDKGSVVTGFFERVAAQEKIELPSLSAGGL